MCYINNVCEIDYYFDVNCLLFLCLKIEEISRGVYKVLVFLEVR